MSSIEDKLDPISGLTGPARSTINMDAFDEIKGTSGDNSPNLISTGKWSELNAKNADKIFSELRNPVQSPYIDLEEQAAQNQSGWEIFGNAIGQGLSEVVLGTLSGVGTLLDVPQYGAIAKDIANMGNEAYKEAETEYTNWFSSMIDDAKEHLQEETFGILQTKDAKEGFAPWDATWWGSNFKSVATTLSLMLPAAGAVNILGKAGKLMGAGTKFLKTVSSQNVAKGLTGALVSRYMENTMEASQTFDEIYRMAKDRGLSESKAQEMAADGAATAWRLNTAALATDIPQYLMGFGAFKGIANKGMKDKSLLKEIAKTVGIDMPSEALEESYQHMVNAEATKKGLGDINTAFGKGFGERFKEYINEPELWTSAFFGALGGGVFSMASSPMRTLASKFSKDDPASKILNFTQSFLGNVNDNKYATKAAQDKDFIENLVKSANLGRLDQFKELIQAQSEENEDMKDYLQYFEEFEKNYEAVKNDGTLNKFQQYQKLGAMTFDNIYKDKVNKLNTEINEIIDKLDIPPAQKDIVRGQFRLSGYMRLRRIIENNKLQTPRHKEVLDYLEKEINKLSQQYAEKKRPKTEHDDVLRNLYKNMVDAHAYREAVLGPRIQELSKNSPDQRSKELKREEQEKLVAAETFTSMEEFDDLSKTLSVEGVRDLNKIKNKKIGQQRKEVGQINFNKPNELLRRYQGRALLFQDELKKFNDKFNTKFTTVNEMIEYSMNNESLKTISSLEKKSDKLYDRIDKINQSNKSLKEKENIVSDEKFFTNVDNEIKSNALSIHKIKSKYKGNEAISKEDKEKIEELRSKNRELGRKRRTYNKTKSKQDTQEKQSYEIAKKLISNFQSKLENANKVLNDENATDQQKTKAKEIIESKALAKAKDIVAKYEHKQDVLNKIRKNHERLANLTDHLRKLKARIHSIKNTLRFIQGGVTIKEDGTIVSTPDRFVADITKQTDREFIDEVLEKYKADISFMPKVALIEEQEAVKEVINSVSKENLELARTGDQEQRRQLGIVYLIARERQQAIEDELFKRDNDWKDDALAEHTEKEIRERRAANDPYLVELDNHGNFVIQGEIYKNLFENPLDALFVDKNGKEKVILTNLEGKKIYFDDEIIIDQVHYLIYLMYQTMVHPSPVHSHNMVSTSLNKYGKKETLDKESLFKNSESYELEADLQEITELLQMVNNVIKQEEKKLREEGLTKKDTKELLMTMDEWEQAKELRRLKKMAETRIHKLTAEPKVNKNGKPNTSAAKAAFKDSAKTAKRKKSKRKNSNLKELQKELDNVIQEFKSLSELYGYTEQSSDEVYNKLLEDKQNELDDLVQIFGLDSFKDEWNSIKKLREEGLDKTNAERIFNISRRIIKKYDNKIKDLTEGKLNEKNNQEEGQQEMLDDITKEAEKLKESLEKDIKKEELENEIEQENESFDEQEENIIYNISDEDFNKFVNTGQVSDNIINSIADKVEKNLPLDIREQAIFNDNVSKIEEILKNKVEQERDQEIEQYEPFVEDREELDVDIADPDSNFSLLVMHQKKMKKTDAGGYIPDVDDIGASQEDPKNNAGIDWDYINNGNVKEGDTLHIELNTTSYKQGGTLGRVILMVKYIDGNPENKDASNRKVVGMVKAYKDGMSQELLDFRKQIDRELAGRVEPYTLNKTVKVDHVLPGWINYDGKVKDVADVFEDPMLMTVVSSREGNIIPNPPKGITLTQNSGSQMNKPGIYLLVPMADGTYRPTRLFTKKIKDVPSVKDKIMKLLRSANKDNWKDKKDELKKYVWYPNLYDFSYTADKGWNVKLPGSKLQRGLTSEQLYDTLNLDEQVAHTPTKSLVEQAGKNFADRFSTKVNATNPVHSAKVGIDFKSLNEEQTETTESDSLADFLNNIGNESSDGLFSLATTPTPILWNEEEEIAWFKKKFPNVPIEVLDNLKQIHGTENDAWGIFKNAAVYIAKDAAKGTTYHEAFHVVFNMYSTPEQKERLLSLAKGDTVLEKEEYLAERFKEFVLVQEENPTLPKQIRDFIKNLWLMIKEIFTDLSLQESFFRMSKKRYGKAVSGSQNFTSKYSINLSSEEIQTGVRMVNHALFNGLLPKLRTFNTNLTDTEIFSQLSLEDMYIKTLQMLQESVKNQSSETKAYVEKFIDRLYDKETNQLKPELYNRIKRGVNLYGYTFKSTGLESSTSTSEETELNLEEDQNFYESWQHTEMSVSNKDRLSQQIRHYLASIPKMTGYAKAKNKFGFTDYHHPSFIYNFLIRNLADTYDSNQMKDKIKNLIKVKPELGIIYADLIGVEDVRKKMGLPPANINGQQLVTHLFTQVAAKAHAEFIMTTQDRGWEERDGKYIPLNLMKVFTSNRSTIRNVLKEDFRTHISSNPIPDVTGNLSIIETGSGEQIKQLMDKTGIYLSPEEAETLTKLEASKKQELRSALNAVIKQYLEGKDIFLEEPTNMNSVFNIIREVKPDLFQLGFRNVEGKIVYSHINPSFTSKQLQVLKDNADWYRQDPLYEDSFLLDELEREDLGFAIMDGYRAKGIQEGLSFDKMDEGSFAKTVIANWWNGNKNEALYPHQILSDSPSMVMFRWKKYTVEESKERLKKVYQQELKRIKKHNKNSKLKNYNTNGDKFLILPFMNDYTGTTEKELDEFIDKKLAKYIKDELDYLVDLNLLVKEEGKYKDAGKNFDHEFNKDLYDNMRKYLLNDLIMQTQLITLFSGDPAFYKKDGKNAIELINNARVERVTVAEAFYKRNKQVWSPGILLDVHAEWNGYKPKHQYNVAMLEDVKIPTELDGRPFTEVLRENLTKAGVDKKAIEDIIDANYNEISVTDAQGFIDIVRLRDIEIMAGRWNNKKEDIYNRTINGEIINESIFNTFKPFYFSHTKVEGKVTPIQIKNSEALLDPAIAAENPTMRKMMEDMGWEFQGSKFKFNENKRKVDSFQTSEAFKVGVHNLQKIEDFEAGKVDWSTKGIMMNNSDYRIQVETPLHHIDYNNLLGTQIRKLIMGDVLLDEMYNGKTGKELLDEYEQLMIEDIEDSFKKLTEGPDAIFNNREALIQRLRDEIVDRGLGEKYLEALDFVGPNAETALPLWHPSHATRIESLLTSIFTNEVIKQKAPGGVLINQTAWGWKRQPKIKFNEDGGVKHFEAFVPASFIFGKNIPRKYMTNGKPDFSKVVKDPDFDNKLLDFISYRIPTEDKYSMINCRIAGFTSETSGGTIILPPEITAIAGLDFDIDKVFAIKKSMLREKGKYSVERTNNTRRIEIMKDILSSPHTAESIFNPNEFETLKDLAGRLKSKEIELGNRNLALAYASTRWKVFTQMQTGKALVGTFANHNASHATMQHHNVTTVSPIKFDGDSRSNLSGTMAVKNGKPYKRISKILASYVAASVDNGKDPVLGFLNINQYTADVVALINRVGYSEEVAVNFINQPIIKKLTKLYLAKGGGKRAEKEAISEILESMNVNPEELQDIDSKPIRNFNLKDLTDNRNSTKMDSFQLEVLKAYTRYKLIAGDLNKLIQATRNDAKTTGPTLAHTEAAIKSRLNMLKSKKPQLKGVAEYMESPKTPSLHAFYEFGFSKPLEILSDYLPYMNGDFTSIKEYFNDVFLDQIERGLNEKEINLINNEYIRYIASDFEPFRENYKEILKRVNQQKRNDFAQKYPEYNVFFNFISDTEVNGENIPTFIGSSGLDAFDQDYITQLWGNMMSSQNEEVSNMAKDLATLSFHLGGFSYTAHGMGHYVPVNYFRNVVDSNGKTLHELLDERINNGKDPEPFLTDYKAEFAKQFVLANFNKLAVVRRVEDETIAERKGKTLKLKSDAYKGVKTPTYLKDKVDKQWVLYRHEGNKEYKQIPTRTVINNRGNVLTQYNFRSSSEIVSPSLNEETPLEQGIITLEQLIEDSKNFITIEVDGKSMYKNKLTGKFFNRVSNEIGNDISLGSLKMQPDNIEKIFSGKKTQTIRNENLQDGLYTLPGGKSVMIKKKYPDKIFAKQLSTTEKNAFARAEGFRDWMDFYKNNKFSKEFINNKTSRYVYEVTPARLLEASKEVGNAIDTYIRDFFDTGIKSKENYPNLSEEVYNNLKTQLEAFKKTLDGQVIPKDVTVHNNAVAGTVDLLIKNNDGTYSIYDIKTKRSGVGHKDSKAFGKSDMDKWTDQLNAYKELFEYMTGFTVRDLKIIPIKVNYSESNNVTNQAEILKPINIFKQSTLTRGFNVSSQKETSSEMNIYAGTNENADLSNFAIRPFTTNVETPTGEKTFNFKSVEQGFHFYKAMVANNTQVAKKILTTTNGGTLKSLTNRRNLPMTNEQIKEWDATSKSVMLNLMYDSFKQNPKTAQRLLSTGNSKLTHKRNNIEQDNGRFSEVITTVREILKEETNLTKGPIDFNDNNLTEEAKKRDNEC